jgi:urease accessory protein
LESDTRAARGARPYVMAQIGKGVGVDQVVAFIERQGGLEP